MARPRKRRRIDTPERPSGQERDYKEADQEDLHPEVRERLEVRNRFKNQLERIFEKYGRDFTGVGDEIDLVTGEVVVDNGHLTHMQEEDDVGDDSEDTDDLTDYDEESNSRSNEPQYSTHPGVAASIDENQEADDALESLYFTSRDAGNLQVVRSMDTGSETRAEDPRWQVPDIPEVAFVRGSLQEEAARDEVIDHVNDVRANVAQDMDRFRRKKLRSPGGSLWTYPRPRRQKPVTTFDDSLVDEVSDASINIVDRSHNNSSGMHPSNEFDTEISNVRPGNSVDLERDYHNRGHDVDESQRLLPNASSTPRQLQERTMKRYRDTMAALDATRATSEKRKMPLEDIWLAYPSIGHPQTTIDCQSKVYATRTDPDPDNSSIKEDLQSMARLEPRKSVLTSHDPNGISDSRGGIAHMAISAPAQQLFNQTHKLPNTETLQPCSDPKASDASCKKDGLTTASSSSSLDLLRLDSDSLVQDTEYTPVSLRNPLHQALKVDSHSNTHHGDGAGDFGLRTWPTSIPNTTQGTSSQDILKSSRAEVSRSSAAAQGNSGHGLRSLDLLRLSQNSSPLSSLSSSDPRIARSFEVRNTATAGDTLSQPAQIADGNVQHLAAEDNEDIGAKSAQNEGNAQIPVSWKSTSKKKSLSPNTLSNASSTVRRLPLQSDIASLETSLKQTNHPGHQKEVELKKSAHQFKSKSQTTSITDQSHDQQALGSALTDMNDMNDVFQMMNDSLAQSEILLEASTKRKPSMIKHRSTTRGASRGRHLVHKPFVPVRPMDAMDSRGYLPISILPNKPNHYTEPNEAGLRNFVGHNQIQKRHKSVHGHDLRVNEPLSRQAPAAESAKGKPMIGTIGLNSTDPNFTTNKEQDPLAKSKTAMELELFQRERETTPIDTFCYLLANPWPTAPLPGDRIPIINGLEAQFAEQAEPGVRPIPTGKAKDHDHIHNKSYQEIKATNSESDSGVDSNVDLNARSHETASKVTGKDRSTRTARSLPEQVITTNLHFAGVESEPSGKESSMLTKHSLQPLSNTAKYPLPTTPGNTALDGSMLTPRKPSPVYKETEVVNQFGKGRPLTRVNLLSQDEIPSTSQETVMSFLNSQATTQASRPSTTLKSSQLAYRSQLPKDSASPGNTCGVDGFNCGRRYCFNCTSRAATQEEIEF